METSYKLRVHDRHDVQLPVSAIARISSVVEALVITWAPYGKSRGIQYTQSIALTSIVRLLALVVLVVLEGVHKQCASNQTGTT